MAERTGGDLGSGPETVGRALRECREAFGRSLEDVAEATRIRLSYLEALEAGDYGAFPGEFWARLFLRSYAQQLGLPPDETIARAFGDVPPPRPPRPERARPVQEAPADAARAAVTYQPRAAKGRTRGAEAPANVRPEGGRRAAQRRSGPERLASPERLSGLGPRAARRQWTSPLLALLAALVVAALLAGIVYNFVRGGAPTTKKLSATAGTSHAAGAGAGASHGAKGATGGAKGTGGTKAPPAGSTAGYATVSTNAAGGDATYRVSKGPIRLNLTFRGRCWIGIQDAGRTGYVLSHTFLAGQSLSFTSAQAIVVDVGSTPNAHGTLNGQPFGPWPTGRAWLLTIEP